MKPISMHPNLPEATSALGTVIKPKQWYECAHCKKPSPLEEREWVGLTGEELQEIYQGAGTVHFKFAMVEAKLKEKNAND